MNDPSNPFQIPSSPPTEPKPNTHTSSQPAKSVQNTLLTKLGQSSTSSPRTETNNRRRFGGLFASFGLSNGNGSPLRASLSQNRQQTPVRTRRTPLRPSAQDEEDGEEGNSVQDGDEEGQEVGINAPSGIGIWNFAERMKELTLGSPAKSKGKSRAREVELEDDVRGEDGGELGQGLMGLPDEIILHILIHLPPTLFQLHLISLISTRFYDLSRTPILWLRIFHGAGFELTEDARKSGLAVEFPPKGEWNGSEWMSDSSDDSSSTSSFDPQDKDESIEGSEDGAEDGAEDGIPIHYPTLIKSRFTLQNLINDPEYIPNTRVMGGHEDVVYALSLWKNFLFTGSRDRSIRIYDLSAPNSEKGNSRVTIERDTHERSVLCLDLDIDQYGKGILVSGSSDCTIGVWEVDLSSSNTNTPTSGEILRRTKTIKGTSSILSIAISSRYIIASSKDSKITVYFRTTLESMRTLEGHSQPVNSISLSPDRSKLVSGSGDGLWKVWNLDNGLVELEGGGGRGVACVEWNDDHIITGDGDNLVKLYSSSNGELIHTFKGHTDLVRSITINKSTGVLISTSYDKTIRMWDINSGELIKIINEDRSSLIFDLKMTPGKIIAARQDNSIHIFEFGGHLPYIDLFA